MSDDRNDETLSRDCQNGDLSAWDVLLKRWQVRIYRYCLQKAADRDDAEDWAQEALVRICRGIADGNYDSSQPFAPWLWSVVRNATTDEGRKRQRRRSNLPQSRWPGDDPDPEAGEGPPITRDRLRTDDPASMSEEENDPATRAIDGETRQKIRRDAEEAWSTLPVRTPSQQRQKEIVAVYYLSEEPMTIPKIAARLGIPPNTARSDLARGFKRLQERLLKRWKGEGWCPFG